MQCDRVCGVCACKMVYVCGIVMYELSISWGGADGGGTYVLVLGSRR